MRNMFLAVMIYDNLLNIMFAFRIFKKSLGHVVDMYLDARQ